MTGFKFLRACGVAALLAAIAMPAAAKDVTLQWLGHATFKLTTPGGKVIVIDPFITKNPKTPQEFKDLKKLGKVDLILVTHGHFDHTADLADLAKLTGAKVLLNTDLGRTYASLGWIGMKQLIRAGKGSALTPLKGVTVTMTRAEHSSEVSYKNPETGKTSMEPGGEPSGYIIEMENGYKVYHAGDTGVFGDMKFIGEYYKPDLALLPIGGKFTMDPKHAAYAVNKLLKTPIVVPIHYGTFKPLKGTPAELKAALGNSATKVVVMQPGETRKF